ncbi:unnamed protein product, partial [Cuscuta campestris]
NTAAFTGFDGLFCSMYAPNHLFE